MGARGWLQTDHQEINFQALLSSYLCNRFNLNPQLSRRLFKAWDFLYISLPSPLPTFLTLGTIKLLIITVTGANTGTCSVPGPEPRLPSSWRGAMWLGLADSAFSGQTHCSCAVATPALSLFPEPPRLAGISGPLWGAVPRPGRLALQLSAWSAPSNALKGYRSPAKGGAAIARLRQCRHPWPSSQHGLSGLGVVEAAL